MNKNNNNKNDNYINNRKLRDKKNDELKFHEFNYYLNYFRKNVKNIKRKRKDESNKEIIQYKCK